MNISFQNNDKTAQNSPGWLYVCFMAAILVYFYVQYSIGEKHFHRCYGATEAAIRPLLV